MEFIDEIKLCFEHNLILGNVPEQVQMAQYKPTPQVYESMDIEKFGFFGGGVNSSNQFFPEVKAEDLVPKEGDFILPVFRALSEVVVHKDWNPIDFSKKDVLRKSMNLLNGATINTNHDMAVEDAIGAVSEVFWEEGYTTHGLKVPSGINARMKIDGKSNPRIARGINMEPPSIHSSSVAVKFAWEKSHPDMPDQDFWGKLASYDKEGQLIRRIATRVYGYKEFSLVAHGADNFAKKIGKDGKIINTHMIDGVENSEQKKNQKYYIFDNKIDLILNSENPTIPIESNNNSHQSNNSIIMKPELLVLAAVLGLTFAEGATDQQAIDQLKAAIVKLKGEKDTVDGQVAGLNTQITALTGERDQLVAQKPDAAKLALLETFKNERVTEVRNGIILTLNKLHDNKPPEAIVNVVNSTTDYNALIALNQTYSTQLDEKYPIQCSDCKSKKVTRASAVIGSTGNEKPQPKSKEEALQAIHGKKNPAIPLAGFVKETQ